MLIMIESPSGCIFDSFGKGEKGNYFSLNMVISLHDPYYYDKDKRASPVFRLYFISNYLEFYVTDDNGYFESFNLISINLPILLPLSTARRLILISSTMHPIAKRFSSFNLVSMASFGRCII